MTADPRRPELRAASFTDIAGRPLPGAEPVTAVIEHTVRRESVAGYEAWLGKVVPIAARFPGHRGVNVIHPSFGGLRYTITIHFDALAHAQDWFMSDVRGRLVREVAPFLESQEKAQTRSGLEFGFHPAPGQPPAKRYEQFLVTLSVIYPLTMVVPALLRRRTAFVPWLGGFWIAHLAAAAVVVSLMVYVVMPRCTRLVSRWPYRRDAEAGPPRPGAQ